MSYPESMSAYLLQSEQKTKYVRAFITHSHPSSIEKSHLY